MERRTPLNTLPWCIITAISIATILLFSTTRSASAASASYSEQGTAFIRVIHASPDIGVVDVFIDGKELLRSFQFASVTDYVPVLAGAHKIQLALIGKGVDAATVVQEIKVKEGLPYTVAALGSMSTGFSFAIFNDSNTASMEGAKTRIYHLAPGSGSAQVKTGDKVLVRMLPYAQASEYITMPADSYDLQFTINPDQITVPLTVSLNEWTITSIFVVGLPHGKPALLLVTAQAPAIPGMPSTGSDPHAIEPSSPVPMLPPVLLAILMLIEQLVGFLHSRK